MPYQKNYLTAVIIRIDFDAPLSSLNTRLPKPIMDAALGRFPIHEPRTGVGQQFIMSFGSADSKQKNKSKPIQTKNWVFHGEEKEKTIDLSAEALVMTTTSYNTFAPLREDFLAIVGEVQRSFIDAAATRFGMRFINEITIENEENPLDWTENIEPNLIGSLINLPDGAKLVRDFHNLELRFDDCDLKVQSGLTNPDYPAAIRRKHFVLDMDAKKTGLIELGEIADTLNSFHRRLSDYFERSITAALRARMNAN